MDAQHGQSGLAGVAEAAATDAVPLVTGLLDAIIIEACYLSAIVECSGPIAVGDIQAREDQVVWASNQFMQADPCSRLPQAGATDSLSRSAAFSAGATTLSRSVEPPGVARDATGDGPEPVAILARYSDDRQKDWTAYQVA